jgi:CheY-like chemotaxis protein
MARTVLYVDYAPRSIGKIRAVLRTLGLQVHLARDGITGLEMFHEHNPDLVLIQDLIPLKHGFEVCREIKNSDRGKETPVILLATMNNGRRLEIFDTGCDSCLEKPVRDDALIDEIRKFIPEVDNLHYASGWTGQISSFDWEPVPFEEKDIDRTLDKMISLEKPEAKPPTRKKRAKKKAARKAKPGKTKAKKAKPKKSESRPNATT